MGPIIKGSKSDDAPLAFRFVSQSGRLVDKQTKSAVRSHAMREVRSRRKRKQEQISKAARPDLCRCSPPPPSSPVTAHKVLGGICDQLPAVFMERCKGCAGILFVESGECRGSSITALALAQFDPFGSMAELPLGLVSSFRHEIEAIKAHAIAFCAPGPVKDVIFPEAIRTPALLTSILYMAYANLCSLRGHKNEGLALGLKTAAIARVNENMARLETATCTRVIASVAWLSIGTWMFGTTIEETETHMHGMEVMVQQRGMDSLGVYKFGQTVRKALLILHLIMAAVRCQRSHPAFYLPYSKTPSRHARHGSPVDSLAQLRCAKNCSPETLRVLQDTKELIDLLIASFETMMYLDISSVKGRLEAYLPASDVLCLAYGDWIYESCRIAGLLLLSAISTPHRLDRPSPILYSDFLQALYRTDISGNWGDMLGVLIFLSFIGASSMPAKRGHRMIALDMAFDGEEGFSAAVRAARRYGKVQLALKKRIQIYEDDKK